MWILFLIPRIEDGNNFGVSIQEDILGEIRTVEVEATTYFDQVSRYFLNRAKIVTKIAKYPHVVRQLDWIIFEMLTHVLVCWVVGRF